MKNETLKEIGRSVSAFFKENHISQEEAAKKLGYASKQIVANQLNGKKFGKKVANKYAAIFGFNELYLLTGTGQLIGENLSDQGKLKKENEELRWIIWSQQETIRSQQKIIRNLFLQLNNKKPGLK